MRALGLSQSAVKRLKSTSIKMLGSIQEKYSEEKHSVSLSRENKNFVFARVIQMKAEVWSWFICFE